MTHPPDQIVCQVQGLPKLVRIIYITPLSTIYVGVHNKDNLKYCGENNIYFVAGVKNWLG